MELNCIAPNIDDFYSYYTSAPTSPRRYNNLNAYLFLSMPTSPTRDDPTQFNFEFEGSKRFSPCDIVSENSQELCTGISYADELFCEGKILPLRPPPRAQYERAERKSPNSSTASSPGTRGSLKKVSFLRERRMWNDGYDPFTSALNKVKEVGPGLGPNEKAQLRRAKSLSPLRLAHGSENWPINKSDPGQDEFKRQNGPKGPQMFESDPTQSRKQRMKKFLLKNASFGKTEKREQNVGLLLRKLNYSVRFSSIAPKTFVRVSKEMKNLMKHRARIFLCLAKCLGTKCTTTNLS